VLDLDSEMATFGRMKITVDLPKAEWAQVMKHTKAKTRYEAVGRAVVEFNRRGRMAGLTRHFGTFKDFMTVADLKRMRGDGKALDETAYLMRSPKNARRLLSAIRSLEAGKGRVRTLREV
jgi:hypothetical protein